MSFLFPLTSSVIAVVCLQGIKQHNPAAYVLNKTVPKHRLLAPSGIAAVTKADGLNPNADTVNVCASLCCVLSGPPGLVVCAAECRAGQVVLCQCVVLRWLSSGTNVESASRACV